MESPPLVSVICLCYNHAKYAIKTIDSVLGQTYKNIEIIIIDDFSIDDSVNVIENYLLEKSLPINFIKNESNLGLTKTFNKAVTYAKGSFLVDLACDDLLLPECISLQIKTYLQNDSSKIAIVYGNAIHIDRQDRMLSYFFEVNEKKKVIDKRLLQTTYDRIIDTGKTFCSVSALINRKHFNELQGYDESLAFEDLDYWVRASRDYEIVFIDIPLVKKRRLTNSHGSQFHLKTSFSDTMDHSNLKILKKILKMNRTRTEHKNLLKRINYSLERSMRAHKNKMALNYVILKLKCHFKIWNTSSSL